MLSLVVRSSSACERSTPTSNRNVRSHWEPVLSFLGSYYRSIYKLQLNLTDTFLSDVCQDAEVREKMQRAKLEQLELQCLGFNLRLSLQSRSIHQRNISGGWPKHELKRQRQRLTKPSCGGGLRNSFFIVFSPDLPPLDYIKDENVSRCINHEIRVHNKSFHDIEPQVSPDVGGRHLRAATASGRKGTFAGRGFVPVSLPPFPATFHTRTCFSVSRLTMLERMWPNPQGCRLDLGWVDCQKNVCEITTRGTSSIDIKNRAMMEWNLDECGSAGIL